MSAAAQAPAGLSMPIGLRNFARQGSESLAAAAKIISDLTAQEVSLVVGIMRERISFRPSPATAERAGRVVTGFTDAGKILLDLAANESAIMADGVKQVMGLRPSIAALVDLVPRGIGTMIDMHKRVLDALAEQTQEIVDSYAEGKPLMVRTRITNNVRNAVDGFIDTQKMFLDQVAEQVTLASEAPKESKPTRKDQSKALIELSRLGVEKYIEAQKQILDIAVERAEAEDTHPRAKAVARTSLAELTRKSVQNFTTAQKSLLDLALNRVPAEEEPRGHRHSRKAARATAGKAAVEHVRKAGRATRRKGSRAAAKEEAAVESE